MRACVLFATVLTAVELATPPSVEMSVVTSDGYVAFTVAGEWPVVASTSKPPVTVFAFQIPNPADEGTPDSTNLAVTVVQLDGDEGKSAFARLPVLVDAAAKRETHAGWELYRQEAVDGETTYRIVDAKRAFRNGGVAIRLAWPRLDANPPDYDARMDRVLRALLDSVREHVGPWERREGEVIRRPAE